MSTSADKPKPRVDSRTGYGGWGALILSPIIFFLPQIYTGLFLAVIIGVGLGFDSDSVKGYFITDACIQVITITLLWMVLRYRQKSLKGLIGKIRSWWQVAAVPAVFGVYFACLMVAYAVMQHFPSINLNQEQANPFKQASSTSDLLIAFIALVIITPVVEEMLFRGFLYRGLRSRMPKFVAAIFTSAIFGLAHGQVNVGVDTFILSMFLIELLERTDSLIPSILLHALKNVVAFVVIFSGRF